MNVSDACEFGIGAANLDSTNLDISGGTKPVGVGPSDIYRHRLAAFAVDRLKLIGTKA